MKRWLSAVTLILLSVGLVQADEGVTVGIDGLSSKTPKDWKEKQPSNRMQFKVFTLPKAEGDDADATLTVFFFGPGGGGGVKENIERWKKMFKTAEADETKPDEFKVGDVKVTRVDLKGTYLFKAQPFNPDSPTEEKANHRMIGVVFESPNGPYFMRLVGPEKTVAKHAKGFEEWLKNFK